MGRFLAGVCVLLMLGAAVDSADGGLFGRRRARRATCYTCPIWRGPTACPPAQPLAAAPDAWSCGPATGEYFDAAAMSVAPFSASVDGDCGPNVALDTSGGGLPPNCDVVGTALFPETPIESLEYIEPATNLPVVQSSPPSRDEDAAGAVPEPAESAGVGSRYADPAPEDPAPDDPVQDDMVQDGMVQDDMVQDDMVQDDSARGESTSDASARQPDPAPAAAEAVEWRSPPRNAGGGVDDAGDLERLFAEPDRTPPTVNDPFEGLPVPASRNDSPAAPFESQRVESLPRDVPPSDAYEADANAAADSRYAPREEPSAEPLPIGPNPASPAPASPAETGRPAASDSPGDVEVADDPPPSADRYAQPEPVVEDPEPAEDPIDLGSFFEDDSKQEPASDVPTPQPDEPTPAEPSDPSESEPPEALSDDDFFGARAKPNLSAPGGLESVETRFWSDVTGLYRCEARMVTINGRTVTLRLPSGVDRQVALTRLSTVDLEFIHGQLEAKQAQKAARLLANRAR